MKYNFTFVFILLLSGVISNAQFLDGTFGNNGIVTGEYFTTNAMALQSDGKFWLPAANLVISLTR